jgi:L-aminopeptidase/D-esterase-like protein
MDGDTLFVAGTGTAALAAEMPLLSVMAAEVTARAVLSGVRAAVGLRLGDLWLPAAADLRQ